MRDVLQLSNGSIRAICIAIQTYELIKEYMNIFIYHLHGDTLFTAFSFPQQARDIIILQLIQSLLSPLQNQTPHSPHKILLSRNVSLTWGQRYDFASRNQYKSTAAAVTGWGHTWSLLVAAVKKKELQAKRNKGLFVVKATAKTQRKSAGKALSLCLKRRFVSVLQFLFSCLILCCSLCVF